jgi:choline dehydrogenase
LPGKRSFIIYGGVFNSLKLLKLSGIGPKAELESFNIPVIVNLPDVGSNLQDNTEAGLNTKAALKFTSFDPSCTFGFTSNGPCLPTGETGVGARGPYAPRAAPNAIMFKSSVAAFRERDIFMRGSPSGARGFWPLSADRTVQ